MYKAKYFKPSLVCMKLDLTVHALLAAAVAAPSGGNGGRSGTIGVWVQLTKMQPKWTNINIM